MTEERIAYRIRQGLNQSLNDISPATLRRLEAARHIALDHQKVMECAPELALAGQLAGGVSTSTGHGFRRASVRRVLAVLALITGMAIAFYWQGHQYVTELEDIDSALLSDDLPPEAFLDKGFFAWLKESSED